MKRIFDIYKELEVLQDGFRAPIVGYTDTHLILALTDKTTASFRKHPKEGIFILPEYDAPQYRYSYIAESTVIKQCGTQLQEFRHDV